MTSGAVLIEGSVRITGQSLAWPKLKAATQIKQSKAVFCVSNVSMDLTVLDMKNHCADLGVRLFFCYNITTSGRSARAFKLAVSNEHKGIITDPFSWPSRVVVRSWKYKSSDDD